MAGTRRLRRWLRLYRLRKVPRRTYIISTTHQRARYVAKQLGVNPHHGLTYFVTGPRAIEGMRFLPGDRIVAEGWPEHVHDVVHRGLIASGVGVRSRNLYDFEVTR